MQYRILITIRIIVCWFASLIILSVLGNQGLWVAQLMAIASLPFLVVAIVIGFAFPQHVAEHPILIVTLAVLVGLVAGYSTAGVAGAVFAMVLVIPGTATFLISYKLWPPSHPSNAGE
jgi:hypothetical protein